ncbi:MAG: helix-turn-helix transcriptional regulator [Candidatus Staskawiczbacteria bacterium]|nr:helix-turn-helix transcriptional regulator [Candidatus Staskawiczbacteria bacterium]
MGDDTAKRRGRNLRFARHRAQLTADQVEEAVREKGGKLSAATIYAYETGRINISAKVVSWIAPCLGVTAEQLLTGNLGPDILPPPPISSKEATMVTISVRGPSLNGDVSVEPFGEILRVLVDDREIYRVVLR